MESDNCTHFVNAITKIICKTREIKEEFKKSYHVHRIKQEE